MTKDILEWIGLNIASISVVTIPNWGAWIDVREGTEFILKVGVFITVVVLNVLKIIEIRNRRNRHKNNDK